MNIAASALNPLTNMGGQVMPGQVAQSPMAMNPVAMALLRRIGPALMQQKAAAFGQPNPGQSPLPAATGSPVSPVQGQT